MIFINLIVKITTVAFSFNIQFITFSSLNSLDLLFDSFFVKNSNNLLAFNIPNNISFFSSISNIAFCKNVFIFLYSNNITNFTLWIFIINLFTGVNIRASFYINMLYFNASKKKNNMANTSRVKSNVASTLWNNKLLQIQRYHMFAFNLPVTLVF